MSRINTNVQSLISRRVLNDNISAQNQALERLSTGLRINSGKDDPAGLIASETLRSSQNAISAAIDNSTRADNILSIAEGGLQEISNLLLELEDLVDRTSSDAGLSDEEVAANQLQVDTILDSINRIADSTSFGSRKILNGAYDFRVSGTTLSNQRISASTINAATIPTGSNRQVTVDVLTATQFAYVSAIMSGFGGTTQTTTTLQIGGIYGSETLTFASGTTAVSVVSAINASKDLTGVSAVVSAGPTKTSIVLTSTTFGADAFVSVEKLGGNGNLNTTYDTGVEGVVTINGSNATMDGLKASVNGKSLSIDLLLAKDFARRKTSTFTTSFNITGGGAIFQISPEAGLSGQATLGIKALNTGKLGNGTVGYLSTLASGQTNDLDNKKFANSQRIVREAIDQVSTLRGRIGAFQKDTIQTNINHLQVALENITAAESAIRDADFAIETSALTRAQILVNSSTATLQLSNAAPQSVLSLLG